MSDQELAPRVENAIAAAAVASIYMLRPVAADKDEMWQALGWRPEADSLDEAMASSIGGFESLSRIVPGGNCAALWRYLYFELAVDPSKTDCESVLRAIAISMRNRPAGRGQGMTRVVGQFLVGPLGVIEFSRRAWSDRICILSATYGDWLSETWGGLRSDWTGSSVRGGKSLCTLTGWSGRWQQWFHGADLVMELNEGICVWQKGRESWSPDEMPVNCRHRQLLDELSSKSHDVLCELLARCIEEVRGEFFDGVHYTHSRAALEAICEPARLDALDRAEVWQLLHVPRLRSMLGIAREMRLVPIPSAVGSFAESLSQALIDSRDLAGDPAMLDHFLGHAQGAEFDQVLHLLLRQPNVQTILPGLLVGNPNLSRALARITASPVRFQLDRLDAWDRTSHEEQQLLTRSIAEFLGAEILPDLDQSAHPLARLVDLVDREYVQQQVARGRRRSEWLLKLSASYLYNLINVRKDNPRDRSGPGFICDFADFRDDGRLRTWAVDRRPAIDLTRTTASECVAVLIQLSRQVGQDSPLYLKRTAEAQQAMLVRYENTGVARAGNLGAHDNRASLSELAEAYEILRSFDEFARSTPDVLPGFVRFVREVREVDRPAKVFLDPVNQVGSAVPAPKLTHYVSRDLQPGQLRGDRVYSFTDVTRNEISVNPIVIDWTPYLLQGT
jgi:hypothetical protein